MNQCPRCVINEIAATNNFCKVCGMDLKAAAGTTAQIENQIQSLDICKRSLEKRISSLKEIKLYHKRMIKRSIPINPRAQSHFRE